MSTKWDVILGLGLLILAAPLVVWMVKDQIKRAKNTKREMIAIMQKHNFVGRWEDCGDGTTMYVVNGWPDMDSLQMLPTFTGIENNSMPPQMKWQYGWNGDETFKVFDAEGEGGQNR